MVLNSKLVTLSPIELVNSFATIRSDWCLKTPFKKWCYLYSIGKTAFKVIGIPLFEDDQTIHWYSYCSYGFVGTYSVLAAYTAYYYITIGQVKKCLPCTCLLGIILCYIPFVRSALSKNRKKFHELIDFAGWHIYLDSHFQFSKYNQYCSEQMNSAMWILLFRLVMLSLAGFLAVMAPLFASFVQGNRTTTIEVRFPFTEENSDAEFILNMMFQFVIYTHGIFIYMGMEVAMVIFGNFIKMSPLLVQSSLKQFDDLLEQEELTEFQMITILNNIARQTVDCDDYVALLREFLYVRTLVTPALFTYSIAMAIFCQFTMGFAAGIGMAVMSWVQLYFICETGQVVENNGFPEVIYDFKWYNLPPKLQRVVTVLLNRKQNGITLTVGPFGTVNRDLFKVVTKKIYSLVMFLYNFSK